jgi:hypothetical protein
MQRSSSTNQAAEDKNNNSSHEMRGSSIPGVESSNCATQNRHLQRLKSAFALKSDVFMSTRPLQAATCEKKQRAKSTSELPSV